MGEDDGWVMPLPCRRAVYGPASVPVDTACSAPRQYIKQVHKESQDWRLLPHERCIVIESKICFVFQTIAREGRGRRDGTISVLAS